MVEPCDCPACGEDQPVPRRERYPLGSLNAEDIDILNEAAEDDEDPF